MKNLQAKTAKSPEDVLQTTVEAAFAASQPALTGDPTRYGIKRITALNWKNPDDTKPFPPKVRGEKWVLACLKPQLDECVPKRIAKLFEVARGSMIYGLFFQPLASLAKEQCYRVLEAGARTRYVGLEIQKQPDANREALGEINFVDIIAALKQADKIAAPHLKLWDAGRHLRNRYSHPKSQTIGTPEIALGVVEKTAELLNQLFK